MILSSAFVESIKLHILEVTFKLYIYLQNILGFQFSFSEHTPSPIKLYFMYHSTILSSGLNIMSGIFPKKHWQVFLVIHGFSPEPVPLFHHYNLDLDDTTRLVFLWNPSGPILTPRLPFPFCQRSYSHSLVDPCKCILATCLQWTSLHWQYLSP
jgi:hypothetical protein